MIDLSEAQLSLVRAILSTHVPSAEVRAFGSRVKGTASRHSDLDLAILGASPLSLSALGDLVEAFQESDLPFSVDIVDWHTISSAFRELISEGYETILLPTER